MTHPSTSPLRDRLLAAIRDKSHRAIVFHNLDEVPAGSIGYLSSQSGSRGALRSKTFGWVSDGKTIQPRDDETFTSQFGPANDERLAELIEAALVPEHHVLVDFEAHSETESDWELGYSSTWTDLAKPTILGHQLSDHDLAHLYFAIEEFGSLGESDAYSDLDALIKELGEAQAQALRDREQSTGLSIFDSVSEPPASDHSKEHSEP